MPKPRVLLLSSVQRAMVPEITGLKVPAPRPITTSARKTQAYSVAWLVRK